MTQGATGPVAALSRHFDKDARPPMVGVAVSGGSDSTALLLAARDAGLGIAAVTVDHGLRDAAADEAAWVARLCAGLDVPHDVLRWRGWDGQGNLPDAARRARYALIADWAQGRGIGHVALGHTADDQAETLVMRLARQAGLDGLAGMAAQVLRGGVVFHRPLLDLRREALRAWLTDRGQDWIDDPTNDDARFRRVRTRAALAALDDAGVTTDALARVAAHLREARGTVREYAARMAQEVARIEAGDVVFDAGGWAGLRADLQRRLMQAALRWVSGADYGARGAAVEAALADIRKGCDTVLHGCRILSSPRDIRVTREARALDGVVDRPGAAWDGRWRVTGPSRSGDVVRALGESALALCPNRADAGLPAASLIASPAVWRGDTLLAAPLARLGPEWSAEMLRGEAEFHDMLVAH